MMDGGPKKWAALSDEEETEKLAATSDETMEQQDGHEHHGHGSEASWQL